MTVESAAAAGLPRFEDVAATQQACCAATNKALDDAMQLVQSACTSIEAGQDAGEVVQALNTKLKAQKLSKAVSSATHDYHDAIKKVGKDIEEGQSMDLSIVARTQRLPQHELCQVILGHLHREGLFSAADALAAALDVGDTEAKHIFAEMHRLVQEGRLEGALQWAVAHRPRLSSSGQPTQLEFKLRRLAFLDLLQREGAPAAMAYAREHFGPFQHVFMPEIKQALGCLLFAHRPLAATPYARLAPAALLQEAASAFVSEACSLLAQASKSPLAVCVAAGAVALPQLHKLALVRQATQGRTGSKPAPAPALSPLAATDTMPIELELGPEFRFHSIFVCPVAKEMTDKGNPPAMLSCGHVLAQASISNIAGRRDARFKCPYCPEETEPRFCKPLVFPPMQ